MITVPVDTAAPYTVTVGDDAICQLDHLIGDNVQRVGLIYPAELTAVAAALADRFGHDRRVVRIEVPSGESAKTFDVARYCWDVLGDQGFTRSDMIIGLGGGATTDLAGFVASAWLRGVGLITIPTTVLGMVDAAVGGKTGINTAAGKNLVGAFYEPRGVLCDLSLLRSLPNAEIRSGAAEIVKCGFIADPSILELIETAPQVAVDPRREILPELIIKGIVVKADTVAADFTETGAGGIGREALNYGHTLGHAIERIERYSVRHGEAISVGMVFAAELARLSGTLDESTVQRHRSVLASLGLPTTYRRGAYPAALEAMQIDKKTRGNQLRFVVLDTIGEPRILAGPGGSVVSAAFGQICP